MIGSGRRFLNLLEIFSFFNLNALVGKGMRTAEKRADAPGRTHVCAWRGSPDVSGSRRDPTRMSSYSAYDRPCDEVREDHRCPHNGVLFYWLHREQLSGEYPVSAHFLFIEDT